MCNRRVFFRTLTCFNSSALSVLSERVDVQTTGNNERKTEWMKNGAVIQTLWELFDIRGKFSLNWAKVKQWMHQFSCILFQTLLCEVSNAFFKTWGNSGGGSWPMQIIHTGSLLIWNELCSLHMNSFPADCVSSGIFKTHRHEQKVLTAWVFPLFFIRLFLSQVPPWEKKKKFNRNAGQDYERPSQSKPRQWLRVCTMRLAVWVSAMQIHRWWAICFNMIPPRRLISLKSGHWLYLSNESGLLWKRAISPWGCKNEAFNSLLPTRKVV